MNPIIEVKYLSCQTKERMHKLYIVCFADNFLPSNHFNIWIINYKDNETLKIVLEQEYVNKRWYDYCLNQDYKKLKWKDFVFGDYTTRVIYNLFVDSCDKIVGDMNLIDLKKTDNIVYNRFFTIAKDVQINDKYISELKKELEHSS